MNTKEIRTHAGGLVRASGLDARQLSRILGYPPNTIREWLVEGRDPQLDKAKLIIERLRGENLARVALQISPEISRSDTPGMYTGRGRSEAAPASPALTSGEIRYAGPAFAPADVPVLGTVAASADGKRGCAVVLDLAALPSTTDEFRVEVLSDSMKELARPGQYLRVSTRQAVREGDLVIADLSDDGGDGEWVFKRYEIVNGQRCLRSVAPGGETFSLQRLPRRWYRVTAVEFP